MEEKSATFAALDRGTAQAWIARNFCIFRQSVSFWKAKRQVWKVKSAMVSWICCSSYGVGRLVEIESNMGYFDIISSTPTCSDTTFCLMSGPTIFFDIIMIQRVHWNTWNISCSTRKNEVLEIAKSKSGLEAYRKPSEQTESFSLCAGRKGWV